MRLRKNSDLILVLTLTILALLWRLVFPFLLTQRFPSLLYISVPLTLPLVLILPGYALTEALFPSRLRARGATASVHHQPHSPPSRPLLLLQPRLQLVRPLNTTDRLLLTGGLSLAADILTGFLLNFLPWGLTAFSWSVALALPTTACTLMALYRRRCSASSTPAANTSSWSRATPLTAPPVHHRHGATPPRPIRMRDLALLFLALMLVLIALLTSTLGAISQPYPGFTQLWIQPSDQPTQTCAVRVGIHSEETATIAYRLTITVDGTLLHTYSGMVLDPQQSWNRCIALPLAPSAPQLTIAGTLHKTNLPVSRDQTVTLTLRQQGAERGDSTTQVDSAFGRSIASFGPSRRTMYAMSLLPSLVYMTPIFLTFFLSFQVVLENTQRIAHNQITLVSIGQAGTYPRSLATALLTR